ncbi:hypothetical protein ACFQ1Q_08285 [Winogradskyella litorisediminis]|uniref:Tetratricopeptide repeat protein n=1 Tax=Winogradskyella litorisediminis TaxID=1156618 RepID=A0ABW3N6E6_9FLAO
MQLQEFTNILQQPEALDSNQIEALESIVNNYPYFQSARALHLKALKNKESYKYNNALKVTAAHTTDRSILFDFITSDVFNQNEISAQIKQNSEYIKGIIVNEVDDISIEKSIKIDDALKEQVEATKGVLDPNLFKQKEEIPQQTQILQSRKLEEQLQIGKPFEFSSTETHSFSEWLKISSFKPIDRTIQQSENNSPLAEKLATIDKFISENPKIKPSTKAPKPKLVDNYEKLEDSLMTETLARIYLEQKNYEKAIQSYRILSLKYPEKSSFFADQIKAVKELSERNNTNND